ncbi:PaaI family thioesterase [bacterium]|nr:MAG: PaaI family thioesterase [bacterium]
MCKSEWEKMMDPEIELPFKLTNWIELAPFERMLGMHIEHAEDGEAVLTMPFTIKLAQGMGLLHGGAITALADTSSAMAIKTLLVEGVHFATVGLETRFLAPVHKGVVTARARAEMLKGQERTYLAEVDVQGENGNCVATFSSTFRVAKDSMSR